MNTSTSDPEGDLDPKLRASLWLEATAHALYESERAENPSRNLPSWDQANRHMRADARYRATGAHMRGDYTVKAVLVERIAQTLALTDGFIWPTCDNTHMPSSISPEQYGAIVAERRQFYLHKARLVITATFNYLDVHAVTEPADHRLATIYRGKAQQARDVEAVRAWKRMKGTTVTSVPITEAATGEGRF